MDLGSTGLLGALLRCAAATLVLALLVAGLVALRRLWTRALAGAAARRAERLKRHGLDLGPLLASLIDGLLLLVFWAVVIALADVWLTYLLGRFEATAPLAERLTAEVLGVLREAGLAALRAVPGLVVVAVIVMLARALAGLLGGLLDRVEAGRLTLPGLYPETVGATRRLATGAVWLVALAAAYPYLPGSGSEAVKGLSLLLGVMVSLGSTGLVSQAMSGLVVVYARALRHGDYVKVGDVEGVVHEVGLLSTKVTTLRGEEVTLPNAVVLAGGVRNFTRLAGGQGAQVSTTVSIGYDAPWRQVEALLVDAARRTPGLRGDVAPYVLQRSLADFYVCYELVARLEEPLDRPQVLSRLHAGIQDAFNAAGVQIMSPHFALQPRQPVLGERPAP